MLSEASSRIRMSRGATSLAKKLISCGTPSSRTTKFSRVSPETNRPRESVTAIPRFTASTASRSRNGSLCSGRS